MQEFKEVLVEKAVNGDKQALEDLILSVKDKVYNLSLRMLWNPTDAEDVTQEILIKVITNLSKFRSESKFTTWVYRIAQNHLINIQKRGLENLNLSFEDYEKGIEVGLDKEQLPISDAERNLLAEELKISCTHAMLLCLDRESRIIYILSSMFGINSVDGGFIMDIKPETYRKRLSRIREKMKNFMENNCGLVNPDRLCRCKQRIGIAIESRRINPEQLLFVNKPSAGEFVEECKDEMENFDKVSAVFTSNPFYLAPENIVQGIKNLIKSDNYKILEA